jgi:hypothetical protein
MKKKWVLLAAALVLTLSIGGAAFAAANDSSTTTPAGATGTSATAAADNGQPWGQQRSDETLLTGDVATQVQAAAVAKVGSDATVVRVETDADGNAKYEVRMVKSDGTCVTAYVDESYNVVSVEEGGAGGNDGGHHRGNDNDADDAGSTAAAATS